MTLATRKRGPTNQEAREAIRKSGIKRDLDGIKEGTYIRSSKILNRHLKDRDITAIKIGVNQVTGTELSSGDGDSARAIGRNHVKRKEIRSEHVEDNQINSGHIGGGEVKTSNIGTDQVTGGKIPQREISRTHLAQNSVTDYELKNVANDASDTAKGERAVGSTHIKPDNILTEHIKAGEIGAGKLSFAAATEGYAAQQAAEKANDARVTASAYALDKANAAEAAAKSYAQSRADNAERAAKSYAGDKVSSHYRSRHEAIDNDGGPASKRYVQAVINNHVSGAHASILAVIAASVAGRQYLLPGSDLTLLVIALAGSVLVSFIVCSLFQRRTRREIVEAKAEAKAEMREEMMEMEGRILHAAWRSQHDADDS